jgi:hypothetical protein
LRSKQDIINAKGIEQWAKYVSSFSEAVAVLKAHEPKYADANSTLAKELATAKASSVCQKYLMTETINCVGSIVRPIWERNAPDTLVYYDEFQQEQLGFAHDFDASGAPETKKRATEYFTTGIKQAVSEFRENAQRDITDANARDAAARQKAQQEFGELLAGIAVASLAVAAGVGMAAYAPPVSYVPVANAPAVNLPTHCTTTYLGNVANTNCF